MLQIFGKNYYLDIDGIVDKCSMAEKINENVKNDENDENSSEDESQTINIFKYEIIKMCIDRILDEVDDVDEEMGPFASNSTTTSFKIAFNTLLKNQIILENE